MFLNDGKVVFPLFIILFTFSRSSFSSCDNVSFGLLGCVLFDSVAFSFSEAFCLDVAQGHMKGAPNETRTHSCRFASRAC